MHPICEVFHSDAFYRSTGPSNKSHTQFFAAMVLLKFYNSTVVTIRDLEDLRRDSWGLRGNHGVNIICISFFLRDISRPEQPCEEIDLWLHHSTWRILILVVGNEHECFTSSYEYRSSNAHIYMIINELNEILNTQEILKNTNSIEGVSDIMEESYTYTIPIIFILNPLPYFWISYKLRYNYPPMINKELNKISNTQGILGDVDLKFI